MMEWCDVETRLLFYKKCCVNGDQFIVWPTMTCSKAQVFGSTNPGFLSARVPSPLSVAIVGFERAPMPLDMKQHASSQHTQNITLLG